MDKDWIIFFNEEKKKEYFKELLVSLDREFDKYTIFPNRNNIYKAFEVSEYNNIKCVIIGQDPYFNIGEAHGLAFSVEEDCKIPPSLRNIYKELFDDLGISRENGNLMDWAKQGVFLINRVLTVRQGHPNSHKNLGWMIFTKEVIKYLSDRRDPIIFMLWGNEAKKVKKYIGQHHHILEAAHPSPLSVYRGFWKCKHFSKCNQFLIDNGKEIINWGEPNNE